MVYSMVVFGIPVHHTKSMTLIIQENYVLKSPFHCLQFFVLAGKKFIFFL